MEEVMGMDFDSFARAMMNHKLQLSACESNDKKKSSFKLHKPRLMRSRAGSFDSLEQSLFALYLNRSNLHLWDNTSILCLLDIREQDRDFVRTLSEDSTTSFTDSVDSVDETKNYMKKLFGGISEHVTSASDCTKTCIDSDNCSPWNH